MVRLKCRAARKHVPGVQGERQSGEARLRGTHIQGLGPADREHNGRLRPNSASGAPV